MMLAGSPRGVYGTFRGEGALLIFQGEGWEVRYRLEALPPEASSPAPSLETLASADLGGEETRGLELGVLRGWGPRMGAATFWLGQTVGGRSVGRPPALVAAVDLPGQRLLLAQITFPWQDTWKANRDLVDLFRKTSFLAGSSLAPERASVPSLPVVRVVPGTSGNSRLLAEFDPWSPETGTHPVATRPLEMAMPKQGKAVLHEVPSLGWSMIPGGVARVEGPHRLTLKLLDLGISSPGQAARDWLRARWGADLTPEARPLAGSPLGAVPPAWVAELGTREGETDGRYHAVVAFSVSGHTFGLEVGPVPPAPWRRWRPEVQEVIRSLEILTPPSLPSP